MSEEKELPSGWSETTIGSVAIVNPRVDVSAIADSTLVSFVPMAEVEAGTGRINTLTHRRINEVKRGYTAFLDGDVLFAKITPCMENGKAAVVRSLISGIGFGSTEFHVLRPREGVDSQLLYYYVSQESFRRTARTYMTGSAGQLRVPAIFLSNFFYPLPPLAEQRRIVSAIEQQFSRLDAGVAALQQAKAKLKRYRAAVLKAAVEGKLTETWRAEHPTIEPASQLLERILKERRAKWEADQMRKMQEDNKYFKDEKWKQKYEEPEKPNMHKLSDLPESWIWTNIQSLTLGRPQNGLYLPQSAYGKGTPILRIDDFQDGFSRSSSQLRLVDAKSEDLGKYSLSEGNLVINRVNSMSHLGKCLLVSARNIPALFESNMMRLRLSNLVNAQFTEIYLRSASGKNRLTSNAKWAVNQASINQTDINNTLIPLPPLIEQQQICVVVEEYLSIISQLEIIVETNLKRAERLRQSILYQAFAGRLVPQDPTDEPASVLLERIRNERNNQKNNIEASIKKNRSVKVPESVAIDVVDAEQAELWESVGN